MSYPSPTAANPYPHLSRATVRNLTNKVQHFEWSLKEKGKLFVAVYGDHEPVSQRMWYSIFHEDVSFLYSTDYVQTPIPPRYSPRIYEQYERAEAKEVVADYIRDKNIAWDLYNLATPDEDPRMHLVLASRHLKRSDLGRWAHSDLRGLGPSVQADRPSYRSSLGSLKELSRADVGEGSGMLSLPCQGSRASLKEFSQADRGESSGSAMSSPRRSLRISLKELSLADQGESSGSGSPSSRSTRSSHRELCWTSSGGSSETGRTGGSVAGRSSAGGSSASLSSISSGGHDDPRFITIESLRNLVLSLLEFSKLSSIRESSSSSSSKSIVSSSTSSSSSSSSRRRSFRPLKRSATGTSIASLPVDSEAATDAAQPSVEPPAGPSAEDKQ